MRPSIALPGSSSRRTCRHSRPRRLSWSAPGDSKVRRSPPGSSNVGGGSSEGKTIGAGCFSCSDVTARFQGSERAGSSSSLEKSSPCLTPRNWLTWCQPLNQISSKCAFRLGLPNSGRTPLMWSASMCVSTKSSNTRSLGAPIDSIRDATVRAADTAPQSMRIRRGLDGSPYSIQRQSPLSAGSISMAKIDVERLAFRAGIARRVSAGVAGAGGDSAATALFRWPSICKAGRRGPRINATIRFAVGTIPCSPCQYGRSRTPSLASAH